MDRFMGMDKLIAGCLIPIHCLIRAPETFRGRVARLGDMTECGVYGLMLLYSVKKGVAQWGECPTYVTQQEKV
jgi:hypothetical protein